MRSAMPMRLSGSNTGVLACRLPWVSGGEQGSFAAHRRRTAARFPLAPLFGEFRSTKLKQCAGGWYHANCIACAAPAAASAL